jgi:hypothetical protein
MIYVQLERKTPNFDRLLQLKHQMRGGHPLFRKVFRLWGYRAKEYYFERFLHFSKGGGDWRSISVQRAREKGHKLILIDSRQLLATLDPFQINQPGSVYRVRGAGVEVGIGPKGRHRKAGISVRRLAIRHQFGRNYRGRRLPVRKIIVNIPPNAIQVTKMRQDLMAGLTKYLNLT